MKKTKLNKPVKKDTNRDQKKNIEIYNIMKYKKIYLLFSGVVLIPGLISLILFGLDLSIDFKGGSVLKYTFDSQENIKLTQAELETSITNVFSQKQIKVTDVVFSDSAVEVRADPMESDRNDELLLELQDILPGLEQSSFESIGPSVGAETTSKAFRALGFASLGILIYIALVFKNIPKPYSSLRFGACAIVAMLHDALFLLGVFSILGKVAGVEVDVLFITAILTVIGFSIHDSIVVFDRIRENLKKLPTSWNFEKVVNFSIVETLNRSFSTSLTVIVTLLSLYLLGGESIHYFVLALLLGIISGTYSSIFNASPLLVIWEDHIAKNKTVNKK